MSSIHGKDGHNINKIKNVVCCLVNLDYIYRSYTQRYLSSLGTMIAMFLRTYIIKLTFL